jgi:DNA polymerase II large subunit
LINVESSPSYKRYFKELDEKVNVLYNIAKKARSRGLDPELEPEPKITKDIAERVEKLIGPQGISKRMRELGEIDRREMSFKVAREIALGRFGFKEKAAAADQAIRTALAIMTEGVTIAPIEGIPEIKIKKNPDKTEYLSIYFAGPIRPAGGTAQALTLVIADVVRKTLGLEKYQPSENEINRFIEEVRVYEREVRRFQYHVTDEDLEWSLKNLPVEATGVSTDPYEVSNYRNISGIETNRVRGGALIVVVDGVVGRARQLCGICDKIGIVGWDWLNKIGHKKEEKKPSASFMEEIIVGRPVFAFPNTPGGFRLRYGRARTTGLAACGIHPSTMIILNKFICTGLQLRIELPGKSAAVCPVDSIEPPVVRLKNGSVIRVDSVEHAIKIYDDVERILFNGDVLINAGDFIQFNQHLRPAGYDEEQWNFDLEYALKTINKKNVKTITGLHEKRLNEFINDLTEVPTPREALSITKIGVPLHPRFTYDWSKIDIDQLIYLRNCLANKWKSEKFPRKLNNHEKKILETLLVPHQVIQDKIVFGDEILILEKCLKLDQLHIEVSESQPLKQINKWAGFSVKEKAFVYVGARMGRPEKAKERKMSPYTHCLYPVGNSVGPQRDITRSRKRERVRVEMVQLQCQNCGLYSSTVICQKCGNLNVLQWKCPRCKRALSEKVCPVCNIDLLSYDWVEIDLRQELENARKFIGGSIPDRIKCVKGLISKSRIPENLSKGILRARYDLSVFKDGTLRYDLTDIPLTHFKPEEIGTSIEKLKEMGYTHDINGERLENSGQMLEIMIQDIVLPKTTGDYLIKVTKFIDDELKYFYKLDPFYECETRDDLIGHIILGLAPHTSSCIVGRLIGWTNVRNCYAHPYWHAAKRRNCDGDEDAILLTLDPLLNFSKSYLPEQSGGQMDAPLFLIPNLNPTEVDKESHNMDVITRYPSEFYKMSMKQAPPEDFEFLVDTLGHRLGTSAQYQGFGYTKKCTNINLGSHIGAYNELTSMIEKLESQLDLTKKLRSVDGQTVALKILNSHFMKDIIGNLRAFTRQKFRCSKCNKKFRRPPLKGVCDRCGGNIIKTVYQGGIIKYINPASDLIYNYNLGQYYEDRITLVKEEIASLFPEKEEPQNQFNLTDFMKPKK